MISNRVYRKGLSFEVTMEQIVEGKETQFDGQIVEVLLRLIEKNGREAFCRKYCTDKANL